MHVRAAVALFFGKSSGCCRRHAQHAAVLLYIHLRSTHFLLGLPLLRHFMHEDLVFRYLLLFILATWPKYHSS